jgi:hypothetical protein
MTCFRVSFRELAPRGHRYFPETRPQFFDKSKIIWVQIICFTYIIKIY